MVGSCIPGRYTCSIHEETPDHGINWSIGRAFSPRWGPVIHVRHNLVVSGQYLVFLNRVRLSRDG